MNFSSVVVAKFCVAKYIKEQIKDNAAYLWMNRWTIKNNIVEL